MTTSYDKSMFFNTIFYSFFFTSLERDLIAHEETTVVKRPNSLFTLIFFPLWQAISCHVLPEMVSPNAITLVGLVGSIQSYQLASYYNSDHATDFLDTKAWLFNLLLCFLCLVSVVCASLSGVHALLHKSAISLSDIFSSVCNGVSLIFLSLTLVETFGVGEAHIRWYLLMAPQLMGFNIVLYQSNIDNLKLKKARSLVCRILYGFCHSELFFLIFCAIVTRLTFSAECFYVINFNYLRNIYILLLVLGFVNVMLLKMDAWHKACIAVCLAARGLPFLNILFFDDHSIFGDINGALAVALLSMEVHVSGLARRRVHAAVICICIEFVFNDFISILCSVLYIIGLLVDLSYFTRIPLFVPLRNVFCDGVFDLCHAGHKKFMLNALKHGNRLIVGVCGDDELEGYKRRPIMSLEERVNEVRLCKFVSQVIPNSPVSGVTEEMIRQHNIHVVVCGEEYDNEGDVFYTVPRRLGILKSVPRTKGISTSILIARIRAASDKDIIAKDKTQGRSTVNEET